ncbi:MAG TPA: sugar phosphate nucleotidyltransferase [Candidatus Saccharimonadales bacterium]|nr:sugar phosphate nucleotidyltransferase [Candidatus Saccharimonadales bacterium]
MKILVTAGGQGTKLWPYSRNDKPKQFQPIIGDTSSYQQTIETLLQEFSAEDIFISTKRKFIKYISEQSPQIPLRNYIVEPDIAKDRGPGEGFAFLRLSLLHPDEPFFLVQADCIREPGKAFLKMIRDAEKLVVEHKQFITGGIKATEPNMGADYLQLGGNVANGGQEAFEIEKFLFRRKSLRETKELIENFHVVAHCNHTCWYPGLMLDAYKQYRPDWYEALMKIKDVLDKPGENEAVEKIYATMEKGSTEEVTQHVMSSGKAMAILLPYKWTDVGTWGSVYEFSAAGRENNLDGNVVTVDVSGSLVKSNYKDKLVAVAAVEDLIIVDTDDVLLIIPKNKIEKIKDIQAEIAQKHGDKKFL